MEFLIATNNQGKLAEFKRILEPLGHTAIGLKDADVQLNVVEDGATYAENAALKANAACKASGMPTLGDDSGLEVAVLSGAPGIRSARFAGEQATDKENNDKLLYLLERTPYAARKAEFVCVVALATPEAAALEVEGRCGGMIGFGPIGENGFGYDPLFLYEGKSFAAMENEEKDKISHRGQALHELVKALPRLGIH